MKEGKVDSQNKSGGSSIDKFKELLPNLSDEELESHKKGVIEATSQISGDKVDENGLEYYGKLFTLILKEQLRRKNSNE